MINDPVFAEATSIRLLPGLSGVRVCLMSRDRRHWFVRKAAATPIGSARLRIQAEKQRLFRREMGDGLRTPEILEDGEHDGRYFFDMEFVQGTDATSHLRSAGYRQVAGFAERLCSYLELAARRPALTQHAARNLFQAAVEKIDEVQARTSALPPSTLEDLRVGLEAVRHAGDVRPTACHGDLTLENIIVAHDGALCAVDLLDTPFEHYWQDIAKLQQDFCGDWYSRSQPHIALGAMTFLSRCLDELGRRLHPAFPRVSPLLVALNFLRILPYVQTSADRAFVLERVEHFAARLRRPEETA